MATQTKGKPAGKYEAFIADQLGKAEQRIRLVDLATAGVGFLAATLAYAVLMILIDRQFLLSDATRQMALLFYLIGSGIYLYLTVVKPLRWRVNPYYAARQLEQTLPTSKNHVLNWIDLRDEKLPGVLRNALGQRAARDLTQADLDAAISNRRALVAGGLAGLLFVSFVALFILLGPRPFASLLGRAFTPFGKSEGIATRTQVSILRPEGGDTTVTIGHALTIVAQVDGRRPDPNDPDAPCLLYRLDENDSYRKRFLQGDDTGHEWSTTILPHEVGNGFFYKVAAGDAETPVYRVKVRAAAGISDFQATYHFRPYVGRAARFVPESRRLEELRGTEVHLLVRTNRTVRSGRLDFDPNGGGSQRITADVRGDDPQALRFRFVLDQPGKYRIQFTSKGGESYTDPNSSDVAVIPDQPPQVALLTPGKNVDLPVNGHLELAGEASDDVGIAGLSLKMEVVGGPRLRPKPYLDGRLGGPEVGTPPRLDYKDLLELPKLADEKGGPVELKPGMEIDYWLEARDACDFPAPNVTESKPRYRIRLTEAEKSPEQKQKEQEARDRQQRHEKEKQGELQKEAAKRREEKAKEDARIRQEQEEREGKREQGEKEGKPEEKDGDKGGKNGADGEKSEQEKQDDRVRKQAEDLKKALDNREKGKGDEGKDRENKPGEGKGGGEKKPGSGKDSGDEKKGDKEKGEGGKPGEGKDQGTREGKDQAGEKKDAGAGGEQGSARGDTQGGMKDGKGEGKEGGKDGQGSKPGTGKPGGQPQASQGEKKGEGKDAGKSGEGKPGESKPGGKPEEAKAGEGKDSKSAGKPGESRPGEGKDGAKAGEGSRPDGASERKDGAKPGEKTGSGKSDTRETNAAGKPGAGKGGGERTQAEKPGENKSGGMKGTGKAEDATAEDARELGKELRQGGGQGREQARKDLENIRDRAADPQAREEARKALEQGGQGEEGPGKGKPAGQPGANGQGEEKTGAGGGQGEAKGGPKPGEASPGAGKEPGRPAGTQGGTTPGGSNPGKAKDNPQGANTNTPGPGIKGERPPGGGGGPGEKTQPEAPEKPAAHRPSALQLEEFRKKVDPDVLKELKMSREDYERFLRDYADLTRRQPPEVNGAPDRTPLPGKAGGTLGHTGGKTLDRGKGKADDLRNTGRPKPPPEYRDAFLEVMRALQARPK